MKDVGSGAAVALVGLFIISANATAMGSPPLQVKGVSVDKRTSGGGLLADPVSRSPGCPATDVGMLASDASIVISSDTCGSGDYFENDGDDCTYGAGGPDEIFQFTVDLNGVWQLDTMTICAGWDTSLMVREETGGGCPGDWLACDGDAGHASCGNYESAVQVFLRTGTTYYLVVDGYDTSTCGSFDVVAFLVESSCVDDGDCDDGLFCNGAETCDIAGGGQCLSGIPPCAYYQTCDEDNDVCIDPDACVSWLGGGPSGFFLPSYKTAPGGWLLDDIELQGHTGLELSYYEMDLIAAPIEDPVGTEYFVETGLLTVEEFTCLPEAVIPGTVCSLGPFYVPPLGAPAHVVHCEPDAPILLPDNSGDPNRCDIDFFIAFRTWCGSVGFSIAGENQRIGGPAADDDYGVSVVYLEDLLLPGIFHATWFGDDEEWPADFANAVVCTVPIGACCVPDHPWDCLEEMTEEDCAALGGTWNVNTFWAPVDCEDPDIDGIPTDCGDNCPDVANVDQEDCDGGSTPEGDACESDSAYRDDDSDGECNGTDGCPNDPDKIQPGICGCHIPDVDSDGDGMPDCHDGCPHDSNKIDPGQCGCGLPEDDTDGDGVADCVDQCPDVDDAVFAPGCAETIPTLSQWGLVVMSLLLLAAGKVYFGRRGGMPTKA